MKLWQCKNLSFNGIIMYDTQCYVNVYLTGKNIFRLELFIMSAFFQCYKTRVHPWNPICIKVKRNLSQE